MRPKYYKTCSAEGRRILYSINFPYTAYLDKECLLLIDFLGNDFDLGNTLKYLWRLGDKKVLFVNKEKEDLKKARFYLERFLIRKSESMKSWEEELLVKLDQELQN